MVTKTKETEHAWPCRRAHRSKSKAASRLSILQSTQNKQSLILVSTLVFLEDERTLNLHILKTQTCGQPTRPAVVPSMNSGSVRFGMRNPSGVYPDFRMRPGER